MRAVLSPPAPRPARAELGADPRDIEERLSPRPCSSSATTATANVFINPAHVAMVEPSTVGDDNVTDVVVAAQDGLALVRVREPIKDRRRQLQREARLVAGAPPGPDVLQRDALRAEGIDAGSTSITTW